MSVAFTRNIVAQSASILLTFLFVTARIECGEKKPCPAQIAVTPACSPCSLDKWAQKVRTLKERPIQFSSLPPKKEYQKNILTLSHFIDSLQTASDAIARDSSSDASWLDKRALQSIAPTIYKLRQAKYPSADDVRNYLYRPCAQRLWLEPESSVILFGDLHGSVHSFIRDLEKLRSLKYINNDFKIIRKNAYLIFLGDYVDRGIYGVEVMYTLARLKSANPHNVIIIRGNHEDYVLLPAFKLKHTKEQEKDNAPSLIDELYNKFDLTDKDEIAIFRFYETLPVVLYLGSGTTKHQDYMQCCHGGIELGYDPYVLIHAPHNVRFELIDKLWRKKNFSAKLSHECQNSIKSAFNLDILCADIRDFVPSAPYWKVKGTSHTAYLGFMWNDFYVDPTKTVGQRGKKFTGWVCGKELTSDVLSWGNSKRVTVQGIFRGHQHNNETGGPMLNLLCCNQGIAGIWDKNVYTLVSAPDSKLDDTGQRCFTYDSFVIIKTASSFEKWKMDHYIQDDGMDRAHWKVKPLKPAIASAHKKNPPILKSEGH